MTVQAPVSAQPGREGFEDCLDTGATVEQMHEAVHCAAALGAGIDLVHGVQMQNALHARGAI